MIAIYILAPMVLIFGLWLFMIAPKKSAKMDKFASVKYAHRGLHGNISSGEVPENSMAAFKRAVDAGFGIELDVRLTSDGVCVVFHDDTLDRVTDGHGKVRDFTLDELKALSLMGTEERIPTFREVLALIDGKVPLLVELKEDGTDASVAAKCAEILKEYKGDFIVESFNPLVLGKMKKLMPNVPRGFLCDKLTENEKYRAITYRIVQRSLLNFIARPAFIAVNHKRIDLQPLPLIRKWFKVPFIAWTITSPEDERAATEAGFSGVIFENYLPGEENL